MEQTCVFDARIQVCIRQVYTDTCIRQVYTDTCMQTRVCRHVYIDLYTGMCHRRGRPQEHAAKCAYDAAEAVRFLSGRATELNVDMQRVGVEATSAGR